MRRVVSFGPFRLISAERLLLRDDAPVRIGGRAIDLLIALVDRAGQIVSKRDLMNVAWPSLNVEEAGLRMHITALRRALDDGRAPVRYIINVPGRGYSFIAPVQEAPAEDAATVKGLTKSQSLPTLRKSLVGRKEIVATLRSLVLDRRFVSVVGPGGIGKTSVAIAVANELRQDLGEDAACFVDLSSVNDPAAIPGAVATAAGCLVRGIDPVQSLFASLSDRRMLIVFDNCEHVLPDIVSLIERLYRASRHVYLLATSREALRAIGETIYLLPTLDSPFNEMPSAQEALASPAVQLFMEKAAESGHAYELRDDDAPSVSRICRHLDGVPLAIELAASRVGSFGIQGIADLMDHGATLLLEGRRSAGARHHTLRDMLDWSFKLLSPREQVLLGQLSVFIGLFELAAAQSVARQADDDDPRTISTGMMSLTDKSLVSISSIGDRTYFRLLETTRAYAAAKLSESGDEGAVARRHAAYFAAFLKSAVGGPAFDREAATACIPHLDNLRKALAWGFSGSGRLSLGLSLAAYAAPLFLELSLYGECLQWCRRALDEMQTDVRGSRAEIELQEAFALSSMSMQGLSDEVRNAIERGLEVAETLGDSWRQYRFLIGLNIFLFRLGDFANAMVAAKRCDAIAERIERGAAKVISEWTLGESYRFMGDQIAALRHFDRGFKLETDTASSLPTNLFGFNHRVRARIGLAHCLWLRGLSDQGRRAANQAIGEAATDGSPISHCHALLYGGLVFLWSGDFGKATHLIEEGIATADKYSLALHHAIGLGMRGQLIVARGDALSAIGTLQDSLNALKAHRYNVMAPGVSCALASGLAQCGRPDEALVVVDQALTLVNQTAGSFWLPDLYRVRGEVLLARPRPDSEIAEEWLVRSIDCARKQSALALELRSALSLAGMLTARERYREANELLEGLYQQFTEGFETRDLVASKQLISELHFRAGDDDYSARSASRILDHRPRLNGPGTTDASDRTKGEH